MGYGDHVVSASRLQAESWNRQENLSEAPLTQERAGPFLKGRKAAAASVAEGKLGDSASWAPADGEAQAEEMTPPWAWHHPDSGAPPPPPCACA